jgi:hypothetical protein
VLKSLAIMVSINLAVSILGNGQNRAQNGPGIDDIDSIDNLPNISYGDPIISTEEFFDGYCNGGPGRALPEHNLEQSPCYSIIGTNRCRGRISYYCKLHTGIGFVSLHSIEHHCKFQEPELHKSKILGGGSLW